MVFYLWLIQKLRTLKVKKRACSMILVVGEITPRSNPLLWISERSAQPISHVRNCSFTYIHILLFCYSSEGVPVCTCSSTTSTPTRSSGWHWHKVSSRCKWAVSGNSPGVLPNFLHHVSFSMLHWKYIFRIKDGSFIIPLLYYTANVGVIWGK